MLTDKRMPTGSGTRSLMTSAYGDVLPQRERIRHRERGTVDVSIVIPVMNEEGSLPELYQRVTEVMLRLGKSYEIVFIDDGSRDASFQHMAAFHHEDQRVQAVRFRRNFGKTAALSAGFARANGRIMITMDADLQDDPTEIPRFLSKLDEGYDLVSGWKKKRNDPISKTLPSRVFNAMVSSTTGIPLHDFNNGFKAYRRVVTDELKLYGELHRFIPVLAYWKGYGVAEIEVKHHPRKHGVSKFGASRFAKGMLDFMLVLFLTRFMQRPLRLFGMVGFSLFAVGFVTALYLTVLKVFGGYSIGTRPLLTFAVLLIVTGVQMFSLGLIGEMQRHFSFRSQEEYSVREVLE